MAQVPQQISAKIRNRVLRDLKPSLILVCAKVGLSVAIGGTLSLLLCGQFGFGLTPMARIINHNLHMYSHWACAILCGGLFSLFPLMILRLICSTLQFRVILNNHYQIIAIWIALFGMFAATKGSLSYDLGYGALWFVCALWVFKAGAWLIRSLETSILQKYAQRLVEH